MGFIMVKEKPIRKKLFNILEVMLMQQIGVSCMVMIGICQVLVKCTIL